MLKKISILFLCVGIVFITLGLPSCCIGAFCPSDPPDCNQFNLIWIVIGSPFLLVSLILYLIFLHKKSEKGSE